MKYRILRDNYSDGYRLEDGEYDSVDQAVKAALKSGYSAPFLIIQITNWQAKPTDE